jgi:hypothetical protein
VDVPGWTPRELEVISGLRELGRAPHPDDAARERIRSDVLKRLDEGTKPAPSRRRRALAEVLAAAVAILIALGGIGLLMSKNALPGDPLYGIKRVGESAELGLTFGDSGKAQKHLEFASNRLDELRALGQADPADYRSSLADFQREARAGTEAFTVLAMQNGGPQLDELRTWAQAQSAKLTAAQSAIPAPAVGQFASSTELLNRIDARVQNLISRLNCTEITSGRTDDLGALPEAGGCQSPPAAATSGGQPPLPLPTQPGIESAPLQPPATTPSPVPSDARPTGELPPSSGLPVPTAVNPPITVPATSRPPTTTTSRPPLISIPPLLPGLPGVGIG